MSNVPLTSGQDEAFERFVGFISDPDEQVFVISGYAGTGKSTLIKHIIDNLPNLLKMTAFVQSKFEWDLLLTATTNKAAQALHGITGREVKTIQSTLGLKVETNWATNTSTLIPTGAIDTPERAVIFIDEASFIDRDLLSMIIELTPNCKLVFIGDPAQIAPINSAGTPVFSAGFPEARLTEVVRQAEGNPIIDLATKFRGTVNTGEWFSFSPDGDAVIHMPRDEFDAAIKAEFTVPGWSYQDSKVLAWTNKAVINYNHGIRELIQGAPELEAGDYAVCNKYTRTAKGYAIKTDQIVQVTAIHAGTEFGVEGWHVQLDYTMSSFLPKRLDDAKAASKEAKANGDFGRVKIIESAWVDLRAAYACTINKSQGSTFKKVFIDLSDVKKCRVANTVARMLYVAVTRASHQVIMTGDLV